MVKVWGFVGCDDRKKALQAFKKRLMKRPQRPQYLYGFLGRVNDLWAEDVTNFFAGQRIGVGKLVFRLKIIGSLEILVGGNRSSPPKFSDQVNLAR